MPSCLCSLFGLLIELWAVESEVPPGMADGMALPLHFLKPILLRPGSTFSSVCVYVYVCVCMYVCKYTCLSVCACL